MPTLTVVEDFDVLKQHGASLHLRGKLPTDKHFTLERREEALDHRIVERRARTTQALPSPCRLQHGHERPTEIRRPAIRVMNQAPARTPPTDTGIEGALYQTIRCCRAVGVPYDATTVEIDHGGQKQPAFLRPDLLDVSAPDPVRCRDDFGSEPALEQVGERSRRGLSALASPVPRGQAPRRPAWCIRRATRPRPTRTPRARSSAWMRGAP